MYEVITLKLAARHDGRCLIGMRVDWPMFAPDLEGADVYDRLTLDEAQSVAEALIPLNFEALGRFLEMNGSL